VRRPRFIATRRYAVFAVTRCLSVRLSRWCIVSTQLKIPFGSPISLVFWPRVPVSNSFNLQQWCKIQGVGKFCSFWLKSRKQNEIGP